MIASRSTLNLLPPRLSMDEYADFVEASIKAANPTHAARQKELEKRIVTPFRMSGLPTSDLGSPAATH